MSPAVPRPSACVCDWVSRCARLCVLRAARSLSTRSQALYEPYLLTVFPLLQPSSYQAGSPLLGGLTAAALSSSNCGPKEQLGRQDQPHEGPADAHPT